MAIFYADPEGSRLKGGKDDDIIVGGDSHDILSGANNFAGLSNSEQAISGNDYIIGGGGGDLLTGDNSPGSSDTLVGGEGIDTFKLLNISEEGINSDDVIKIVDFTSEDKIVLGKLNGIQDIDLIDYHYGGTDNGNVSTGIYTDDQLFAYIEGTEHFFLEDLSYM